jgi:hypothetical protein
MEALLRLGSVNPRNGSLEGRRGLADTNFVSGRPRPRFVSITLRDLARRGFLTGVIRSPKLGSGTPLSGEAPMDAALLPPWRRCGGSNGRVRADRGLAGAAFDCPSAHGTVSEEILRRSAPSRFTSRRGDRTAEPQRRSLQDWRLGGYRASTKAERVHGPRSDLNFRSFHHHSSYHHIMMGSGV